MATVPETVRLVRGEEPTRLIAALPSHYPTLYATVINSTCLRAAACECTGYDALMTWQGGWTLARRDRRGQCQREGGARSGITPAPADVTSYLSNRVRTQTARIGAVTPASGQTSPRGQRRGYETASVRGFGNPTCRPWLACEGSGSPTHGPTAEFVTYRPSPRPSTTDRRCQ